MPFFVDNELIPVLGACVTLQSDQNRKMLGQVVKHAKESRDKVLVHWYAKNDSEWLVCSEIQSGFMPGMDVLEVPSMGWKESMGEGVVLRSRIVASAEQILVEFMETGRKEWVPWQNLRQIRGVRHQYILGEKEGENSAERFRLRTLAWALKLWNENSGALARFDIDPLPHQINMVHHILASGDLNWLIADDVGLGKTIETGLILAALRKCTGRRRILLITPAGLTKQWQEELQSKFGIGDFRVFGDDFSITEPRHWKMYDYVIGSIDRLKTDRNMEILIQAAPWDLVIFDEAHRLTRRQYGMKYASSQRYELARALRARTGSILMLSATPHQGQQDGFIALLELLRPDRRKEFLTLDRNPEILKDMVFRNRKADVTDLEGNFIFHGKSTCALKVPICMAAHAFDGELQSYINRGYNAGKSMNEKGNAIGFVMTVYRKLSSSSISAIHSALVSRRKRLRSGQAPKKDSLFDRHLALNQIDQRFQGESEEVVVDAGSAGEFFDGEMAALDSLVEKAKALKSEDRKLKLFLEEIIASALKKNSKEKLVIFSEYRVTQKWLCTALVREYGASSTVMINGSMNLNERKKAISEFEGSAQFLLSTEAGGEGINLQRRCNVMVNYDLPWNPMRLVQRIGRLYRYGQKKRVVVFNIHSPDTIDEKVLTILYERLGQVVSDMAPVGVEYSDAMKDDVLGELAELVDVEGILESAGASRIDRTSERIDEALARAKNATKKQNALFDHVSRFSADEFSAELSIGKDHLRSFVKGMIDLLEIEIVETQFKGEVWDIRFPEVLLPDLGTRKTRQKVCFDRELACRKPELHMLDSESWFFGFLLKKATSPEFSGKTAAFFSESSRSFVLSAVLRWQDIQGNRVRQEFACVQVLEDGEVTVNAQETARWLKFPLNGVAGVSLPLRTLNEASFGAAEKALSKRLSVLADNKTHPDGIQWISGGWSFPFKERGGPICE